MGPAELAEVGSHRIGAVGSRCGRLLIIDAIDDDAADAGFVDAAKGANDLLAVGFRTRGDGPVEAEFGGDHDQRVEDHRTVEIEIREHRNGPAGLRETGGGALVPPV